ncbi:dihydrofolate reductase [Flavobacterium sp. W4I14]|nr:dihydrofolate reductase [Flavobacterium sp. W4I14]
MNDGNSSSPLGADGLNDRTEKPLQGLGLSIAVAIGENFAIGKNNQLLWHMPADLKFFKQTTSGHTVVMGRKTFDSVGRPLPNRRNIVITRDPSLKIAGVEVVNSLDEALAITKTEEKPVFIVGGAEIYKQALPKTATLYLTTIHHHFDADTFFPEIDRNEWKVISSKTHKADEKNKYDYTFEVLERI